VIRDASLACAAAALLSLGVTSAQNVPTGFDVEFLVGEPFTGQPVGLAHLPDGRAVLIERSTGVVRIAPPGSSSSDSIATIPGVESVHVERGLLGVAVDPDWPSRPYIYFYYNHTSGNVHLTMFTASGDLAIPSSTTLTLGSPFHLLADIPDANGIHNGGSLRFGPDGMLYASVGEDAQACQAQDLTSLLGCILRLDISAMPGTGTGPPPKSQITPPDNPFPGPNENEKLRFAGGLRNPFRFTIDPLTGDLIIGDVGSSFFEEINRLDFPSQNGANYGWPQLEGSHPIFCCGDCGEENPFTAPIATMPHPEGVISIIGGPVVRGNSSSSVSFPPSYEGNILFFEFFSGVLRRLVESNGAWIPAPPVAGQPDSVNWGTGCIGACDAQMGPDGALYFAAYGLGGLPRGLYRILHTLPTSVPERARSAEICRAHPNPARAGAGVRFELAHEAGSKVELTLKDVLGRKVRRIDGILDPNGAGAMLHWDGRNERGEFVAPGIFFWTLESETLPPQSGKITILR
jgi:glucose/arabinose dehydrogenase